MSTNDQIQSALKDGAIKEEAAQLAVENDVHTLMGKLKALYERVYGEIKADLADWHWHATKLKNEVTGEVHADEPSAAAGGPVVEPNSAAPSEPASAPSVTAADGAHSEAGNETAHQDVR